MLNTTDLGIIIQITKHCKRIIVKTNNINISEFINDEDVFEIVCLNLLQIGELVNGLSNDFVQSYNKIPWSKIKGMRNKIVHGYGTVDKEIIYNTATSDIKNLQEYCEKICNQN